MLTLLFAMTALIGTASGAEGGDVALRFGPCVHCHGAHGEGRPELGTPRLGDLDPAYIEVQLRAMRDGTRGAHPGDPDAKPMVAMARGIAGDAVVRQLAAYVAALEPEHRDAGQPVPGGARAYASCGACHGSDARGNAEVGAPSLLFQHGPYLVRQLQNYRDGKRGAEGAPAGAQAMAAQVRGWSDAEIDTVVAHIASLRPPRPPVEHYPVTLSRDEGLAAFADIYAVATHPRCMNCHPAGDAPLHTDESVPSRLRGGSVQPAGRGALQHVPRRGAGRRRARAAASGRPHLEPGARADGL